MTGFEGADTADGSSSADRSKELGGTGITVSDDRSILCSRRPLRPPGSNIWKQVAATVDSLIRLAVMNEVEKCSSGAITYVFDGDVEATEAHYRTQVCVIDDGPLWVTGQIPTTTSDGTELEVREQVTI